MAKFEIHRNVNGTFYYQFRTQNEEMIFSAQGYGSEEECRAAISDLQNEIVREIQCDRKINSDEMRFFNLRSQDGTLMGTSKMFVSASDMDNKIEFVMNSCAGAEIVDMTEKRQPADIF